MTQLNLCLTLLLVLVSPVLAQTKQIYAARGVVKQIAPDHRHATIQHEAIPGYMLAMTMDLAVRDTNGLNSASPGDIITFDLVVTADDDWVDNIVRVGSTNAPAAAPSWHVVESELNPGDELPDYEFTSETGGTVRFSEYRGRAVAFTFFFTSCPLPEFCPRMNKHFSEARTLLLADTNAPSNWQFMSISFDSAFDQPQILAGYAKFYRGEATNGWLFAVASPATLRGLAPKVDLNFWKENGSYSHNLRTVVLDVNRKIFRQFDGNEWTPQQLADAMRDAARVPTR